jgi:hypothetical protein
MNDQKRSRALAPILTAVLVGALFLGGVGGYALAKAEGSAFVQDSSVTARALRWDHEERTPGDASTPRASRWDHEERP